MSRRRKLNEIEMEVLVNTCIQYCNSYVKENGIFFARSFGSLERISLNLVRQVFLSALNKIDYKIIYTEYKNSYVIKKTCPINDVRLRIIIHSRHLHIFKSMIYSYDFPDITFDDQFEVKLAMLDGYLEICLKDKWG